jgi:phosphatidylglycerophosphatase A
MSGRQSSGPAIYRPGAGFLIAHPAHFVALGFGTGLSPVVPGAFGSLLAIPLYALLAQGLTPPGVAAAIAALFVLGIWACGKTGRDLGVPDHGAMTWDEVVAFLAVLLVAPAGGWWTLGAFVAFRFFDMVKPPPIRYVERALKGGLGVMADDAIAAFYTLIVLAVAKRLVG